MVDRGASSQHMNMLQRIVSEQWYPAECRQRVPTAKSVMKTLSKGVHVCTTYIMYVCVHTYVCTVLACLIDACMRWSQVWYWCLDVGHTYIHT